MKINNYETYLESLKLRVDDPYDTYNRRKKALEDRENKRKEVHNKFPFLITVEGHYEELDELEAEFWDMFGPMDGVCKDPYKEEKHSRCSLGNREAHSHEGKWTGFWITKTDYDYGFQDFCFSTKEQLEAATMSLKKQQIRDKFRRLVFKRDNYKCRLCDKYAEDAHHITDRNEMPYGGYVISNGISLCEDCHKKAEEYHSSDYFTIHPDDLYKIINSSKEQAISDSERELSL